MSERQREREGWQLPENAEVQLDLLEDVEEPSEV